MHDDRHRARLAKLARSLRFGAFSPLLRRARNIGLLFLFLSLLGCGAQVSPAGTKAVTPQAPSQAQITRKTSKPYTGDLSIFETRDREEKLHINRVMDILKI